MNFRWNSRVSTFAGSAGLLFFLVTTALSQLPGAMNETTATRMGGTSFIVGTVYLPSGVPVSARMGIRLVSPIAGDFISTTDDRGQFIFSGLREGIYSIVIEGERDFEPVNQVVDVLSSRSGKNQPYNVTIRLTEKLKTRAKPGVIQAGSSGDMKRAVELYTKALELSAKKDHRAAIEQLKLALEADPFFVNGFNELGVQYMRLNELERAEESLLSALKIKPAALEPMLNRGIVLFRMDRLAEADEVLRNVIKLDQRSAIAHFYLGRNLAKTKAFGEAEKELNLAIEYGGNDLREAHRILAMIHIETDDRARAVKSLETYLKLNPNAADAAQLHDSIAQLKAAIRKP